MMTDSQASVQPALLLAPRRGAAIRTLLEGVLSCAILIALAGLLQRYAGSVGGNAANALGFLGLLLLTVWPAWRLRPIERPRWWARALVGLLRAAGVGALLALVGSAFSLALRGSNAPSNGRLTILFGIFVWFLVLRTAATVGGIVARRVRRRLRWQLIVSHVGIIMLMFVILTSAGSVLGLTAATYFVASHPIDMALSVRDDLQLANGLSPLNVQRTDEVFRLIDAHRLPLRGESPLITFVRAAPAPNALGLVARDGRVLDGRVVLGRDGKQTRRTYSLTDLTHLTPTQGARLRRLVFGGHAGQEPIHGANGPETVSAAPVRARSGVVTSMLVLRVTDYQLTGPQFFRALLTIFGLSTIALILVTALPVLGLSFLFSYLVARGLTRRLESLSGITTSIASGNFEGRAAITTSNEVGRLARDINRMADGLQTTMGELEGARAQSEEALRLRRELVANISHELRTPLATMHAHLETIHARDSGPAGLTTRAGQDMVTVPHSALQALEAETERLESLVDDLFALSRAQAGAIEMRPEAVDVAALVEEIAALMRPLAQREGRITLSAEILRRPLRATVDPARLQQILANLIRNAVRHTPDGGLIAVSAAGEGEWVRVSVADTGEGIPAEHLAQIFDRFYRVDSTRSRATGGAGLGLAIVREFVELMGGHVKVESCLGEGTRFHVFLPAVRVSDSTQERMLA